MSLVRKSAVLIAFLIIFSLIPVSAAPETAERSETPETVRTEISLPVIMYHAVLKNESRQNRYTITPKAFESDLKWLRENGYQSISVDELIAFAENGAALPEKPILLTFDDGYYNNIHYAGPLLEEYNQKAVLFVVGEFTDRSTEENKQNPNFSYVSWDTIAELDKNIWNVENHTYGMHRECPRYGVTRKHGEDKEDYTEELKCDLGRLTERLTEVSGRTPVAFAYPFGAQSVETEQVLTALGYKVSVTSFDGISVITAGKPETLRKLKRRLRSGDKPIAELVS